MRLTTERLLLRDFVEADWEAVLAYQRDPMYLRYYDEALIGQGLTATISTGPGRPPVYSWQISGGGPFKSYAVAADASRADINYLAGADLTSPSCHFYCRIPGEITVTCNATRWISNQNLNVVGRAKCTIVQPT